MRTAMVTAALRWGGWFLACGLLLSAELMARQKRFTVQPHQDSFVYDIAFTDALDKTWHLEFSFPKQEIRQALEALEPFEVVSRRVSDGADNLVHQTRVLVDQARQESFREHLDAQRTYIATVNRRLPDSVQFFLTELDGFSYRYGIGAPGSNVVLPAAEHRRVKALIDQTQEKLGANLKAWKQAEKQRDARRLDRAQTRLDETVALFSSRVLYDNFLLYDNNLRHVRLDYARISHAWQAAMVPLAQSLKPKAQTLRTRVRLALNFFQSIPYDELLTRNQNRFSGFATPQALIHINHGDCDTKSSALGATLATLTPELDTIMVLIPGHAFFGVTLAPKLGDRTLNFQGKTYVLAESAGPAITRLGVLAPQSRRALDAHTQVFIVPLHTSETRAS